MYISLWENYRGHPDNISFMQFSTKIDGFEQKDSQGFENSYNSYEQYPLEKFFIFTIYQNYTLALSHHEFPHLDQNRESICMRGILHTVNWQNVSQWQPFLKIYAQIEYMLLVHPICWNLMGHDKQSAKVP